MISRIFSSLILVFLLSSCSVTARVPVPGIVPAYNGDKVPASILDSFPSGRWRFVHSMSFHLAAGGEGTALGVVALDGDEIRCALTTVEGLVLFAAREKEGEPIQVSRAVSPFDKKGFAKGLVRDVRTIFVKPKGTVECGRLSDGTPLCRWSLADQITDVLPKKDGCHTLNTYSDGLRSRTVDTRSCTVLDSTVIPEDIDLVASGAAGYSLNMHLVSAEKLPAAK